MGRSASWVDEGRRDLRLGDMEADVEFIDVDSLWSLGRSVEPKLRQAGLSGGVDSPDVEEMTIIFLHFSQMPDIELIASLHVLQIATVVE